MTDLGLQSITVEDTVPPGIFEKQRENETRRIIELKKSRRIETKTFSYLFESRETVLNQINEMIFIEKVKDREEIQRLIEVYSELLPRHDTLSVSMFIEFRDERQLLSEMPKLAGVENSVYMSFDGNELRATPEEGRSTDVLESTLQYLKFHFTPDMIEKFKDARNVYIETRKEGYLETAKIPSDLLSTLKKELSN